MAFHVKTDLKSYSILFLLATFEAEIGDEDISSVFQGNSSVHGLLAIVICLISGGLLTF